VKDWQIVSHKYPKVIQDVFKSTIEPKYEREGVCSPTSLNKRRIPIEIWRQVENGGYIVKDQTFKQGDK
jgi:hypothetical protein